MKEIVIIENSMLQKLLISAIMYVENLQIK